ncbi:hypothetical protein [Paraburkholderia sp.]|uniref:hypothetical protein n=1 Tax=Paraburkholderia sp. TaxID=1926495 RepID=UPI002395A387|nr:hypothetical protein [Paraburkholderia sp.]MDE1183853.1 hypothetical protein [Paraburkholderia sp.]
MFDVIPYWMWAASLLVLALVCGAALSPREDRSIRLARSRSRASAPVSPGVHDVR